MSSKIESFLSSLSICLNSSQKHVRHRTMQRKLLNDLISTITPFLRQEWQQIWRTQFVNIIFNIYLHLRIFTRLWAQICAVDYRAGIYSSIPYQFHHRCSRGPCISFRSHSAVALKVYYYLTGKSLNFNVQRAGSRDDIMSYLFCSHVVEH